MAMALPLAGLGARDAAASPQASTWLQPGRGARYVAPGNLAIALARARETGPSRLEWSGRSPTTSTSTTARQPSARAAGPREPRRSPSHDTPGSATNGSPDSRTRLLDGRGDDYRQRKRLPDAWASLDPSHHRSSVGGGTRSATPPLRLTSGEAVYHDANAPPARAQSLVGRLS